MHLLWTDNNTNKVFFYQNIRCKIVNKNNQNIYACDMTFIIQWWSGILDNQEICKIKIAVNQFTAILNWTLINKFDYIISPRQQFFVQAQASEFLKNNCLYNTPGVQGMNGPQSIYRINTLACSFKSRNY